MSRCSNWLALFFIAALLPVSFSLSPPSGYLSDAIISNSEAGYASSILYERFLPLSQIRPISGELTKKAIQEISLQFLSDNKDSIGITPSTLRVSEIKQSKRPEVPTSGFFYAFFQQYYKDIPVYGSYVNFLFIDDKLASMRAKYYPKISLNTVPKITQRKAEGIARKAVDSNKLDDENAFSSQLYILPKSEDGRDSKLVWIVELTSDSEADSFSVTIDAQSGKVLEKRSTVEHATIQGTVTGDVWMYTPLSPSNRVTVPFAHLNVTVVNRNTPTILYGVATTDSNGYFSIQYNDADQPNARLNSSFSRTPGQNPLAALSPYASVYYDTAYNVSLSLIPRISHAYDIPLLNVIHNWIWDEDTPWYRDRNQEANAFYHINAIRDFFAAGVPPFNQDYLYNRTQARLQSSCNAWASNGGIFAIIGLGGSNCGEEYNFALYASVIYHEFGHIVIGKSLYTIPGASWGMISPDGVPGTDEGRAMDEAFGDYYGASRTNEPSLFVGRNLDNTNRYPINYVEDCPGCLYGNSLLFSGAKWDLRQSFLTIYGSSPDPDLETNGIYRADAMLLQTYMAQPRNFSWFFDDLIQVAAGTTYGGDGNDIYSAPDRQAICDSFNFKHSLLPALAPYEYCARKGDVMPTKAPQSYFLPYYSFYRGEEVWANGTSFAPRTSADIYIVPHVDQRTEGSAIENPILPYLTVTFDVYGAFNTSLWAANQYGSFDIIVDTDRDGIYNSDVDSLTTFTVLAPSIIPSDESGEPNWPFIEGQTVYAYFSNFPPNQVFDLVIVPDSSNWANGAQLNPVVSFQMFSADGTPFTSPIWEGAAQGTYDIVADLDQDGLYDEDLDTVTGLSGSAFTVMPSPPACIPIGNTCIPNGVSCCVGSCNPTPECSVDSDCTNSFYNRCENRICVCDQGARCPDRIAIEYTCSIGPGLP